MSKNEKSKIHPAKFLPSNLNELQNVRIIQKNLLYVIGLSARVCDRELLIRKEFFGQYGKIKRLVVNNSKAYNPDGVNGPSFSAYVSFSTNQECSLALLSIDNTVYDGHILKASFGSTKYCLHFLRNMECINKECLFLHNLADEKDIINKDETNNKNIFLQNQYLAMKICDIFNPTVKNRLTDKRNILKNSEFPPSNTIYSKDIVIDVDASLKKQKYLDGEDMLIKDNLLNEKLENCEKLEKKAGKEDLKNLLNKSKNIEKSKTNLLSSPSNKNNEIPNVTNEKRTERKYSDVSISSERTFITDNPKDKKRSIFSRRFRSRFDFCSNDEKDEGINIPEYISGIISLKCCTYFYLKNLDMSEFIISNKIHFEEFNKLTYLNTNQNTL